MRWICEPAGTSGLVKQQKRQQPRHPPVAVVERMDHQEVEDICAGEQQPRVLPVLHRLAEALVQLVHRHRGFEGSRALEDHGDLLAGAVEAGDLVLWIVSRTFR